MLARRLPGVLPRLEPGEALEVTRIHSVAGLLSPERPLIREPPFRAPHHSASMAAIVGGGRAARPGRGQPGAPRRPAARRAARVHPAGARGAAPAARGRRRRHRPRGGEGGLPGALPARRDHEPLSLRRARRLGRRVLVLAEPSRRLPRQALPRAPRPLRPRRHGPSTAGGRAGGRAVRAVGCRGGAGGRRPLAARRSSPETDRGGGRAARHARSSGCRSRAAAAPGSPAWRGPSPRSQAPPTSGRSTSPRRSGTARPEELEP